MTDNNKSQRSKAKKLLNQMTDILSNIDGDTCDDSVQRLRDVAEKINDIADEMLKSRDVIDQYRRMS